MSLLDSPLNNADQLRAVYVKTDEGVLFEVKPLVRIPRTYSVLLVLCVSSVDRP